MRNRYCLGVATLLLFIYSTSSAQSTAEEGTLQSFLTQTHVGGYGEIKLSDPDGSAPARLDIERFVIYLDHYFNEKWAFKSETEIEHVKIEGGEGGEVALEQAFLDWHASDAFGWRVGLLLIPMGIINQTHEPNTFYSVDRPVVDEVVIPSTWREIGTGIYGTLTEGLKYQAYISEGLRGEGINAEGMHDAKQEGSSDEGEGSVASHPAVSAKLSYTPIAGLQIGVSSYFQPSAFAGLDADVNESLLGAAADIRYDLSNLRLRAVAALWSIRGAADISTLTMTSIPDKVQGAYLEAAYNILPLLNADAAAELVPFVRYEDIVNPDLKYLSAGFAYKPLDNVILKADYRWSDQADGFEGDKLSLGAGFAF